MLKPAVRTEARTRSTEAEGVVLWQVSKRARRRQRARAPKAARHAPSTACCAGAQWQPLKLACPGSLSHRRSWFSVASTMIRPCFGVNLSELPTRFVSTWVIRPESHITWGNESATRCFNEMAFVCAQTLSVSHTPCAICAIDPG